MYCSVVPHIDVVIKNINVGEGSNRLLHLSKHFQTL